jgi:nitroimidazol reductase NimA-like FMN-containing flavoprotein (pyridoxamine 5'-phosphate oxidase superfamily)
MSRRRRGLSREDAVEQGSCMATARSDDIKALLDRPNFVHLATVGSDGAPLSEPVWVGLEGDRVLVGAS